MATVLDLEKETFVVYIAFLNIKIIVYLTWKAQIALLIIEKITILEEYLDFANIFSKELAAELSKLSDIKEYLIDLEPGKQLPFRPIYSLWPIELETVKSYIKVNLANGFIQPSKSPARAPILFDWKPNGGFRLCVDYCGFNNLTIKNQYPLPLISKFFNWLGHAKCFIQFDLTSVYYWIRIKKDEKWKTALQT